MLNQRARNEAHSLASIIAEAAPGNNVLQHFPATMKGRKRPLFHRHRLKGVTYMYAEQLYQTLRELIRLPSTSGHEEQVREYLASVLASRGLESTVDSQGNLIAFLPGEGRPLLLNAHMDRVPPGLGHEPVLREGVLYSDGTTNLGADDCAGLTIILEVLRRTLEQGLPHPPLVLLFTVMEETGLCGASRFDASAWHIEEGLVFDNAFEAGV